MAILPYKNKSLSRNGSDTIYNGTLPPASGAKAPVTKATKVRYGIMLMLFLMTAMNYADRATLSITGSAIKSTFGISSITLGYMFSAFAWTYVIAQIPGGRLLNRFGSRRVYAVSIFFWSLLTFSMGFVIGLPAAMSITAMFVVRILIGLAEAPAFPGNSRIVATWFPAAERGTTSALFTSASYFATVVFAPMMGWVTQTFGWQYVYMLMGTLGLVLTLIWTRVMYMPKEHPRINQAELDYIVAGGALVDIDERYQPASGGARENKPAVATWPCIREILSSRMMIGILVGQYCVNDYL